MVKTALSADPPPVVCVTTATPSELTVQARGAIATLLLLKVMLVPPPLLEVELSAKKRAVPE
jgi:hypothetical protein